MEWPARSETLENIDIRPASCILKKGKAMRFSNLPKTNSPNTELDSNNVLKKQKGIRFSDVSISREDSIAFANMEENIHIGEEDNASFAKKEMSICLSTPSIVEEESCSFDNTEKSLRLSALTRNEDIHLLKDPTVSTNRSTSTDSAMMMSFAKWSKEDFQSWTCASCTYVNENQIYLNCEVCGQDRPNSNSSIDVRSNEDDDFETRRRQIRQTNVMLMAKERAQEIQDDQKSRLKSYEQILDGERNLEDVLLC